MMGSVLITLTLPGGPGGPTGPGTLLSFMVQLVKASRINK